MYLSRRVAYETARRRLYRYRVHRETTRAQIATQMTEVTGEALGVDGVGVWLFANRRRTLECMVDYDVATRTHRVVEVIDLTGCENYVAALDDGCVLVADDVISHPLGSLLIERGIRAMLEVPIVRDGIVIGVLRCEHRSTRAWSQDEFELASAVATLMMLAFEQTTRLELETMLVDSAERRRESERLEALGRMAGGLAHEFANVLGVVGVAAQLVSVPDDAAHAARLMRRVIETGRQLCSRLLVLAANESDDDAPTCDLGVVIEAFMPVLQVAMASRGTLSFHSLAPRPIVPLELAQIELMLLHLILDARDALTEHGQVRIALREATPDDDEAPSSLLLTVNDNGTGRVRRADPFAPQIPVATNSIFELVRNAGGALRLESDSTGNTVTVVLPRA